MEKEVITLPVPAVKRIVDIMTIFDFAKVLELMEHFDITWGKAHLSEDDLKDAAFKHLINSYLGYMSSNTNDAYYVSSGGFEASYWYDDTAEGIDEYDKHNFGLKYIFEEVS